MLTKKEKQIGEVVYYFNSKDIVKAKIARISDEATKYIPKGIEKIFLDNGSCLLPSGLYTRLDYAISDAISTLRFERDFFLEFFDEEDEYIKKLNSMLKYYWNHPQRNYEIIL